MGLTDINTETGRREFQGISQRVVRAVNPRYEKIPDALTLQRKIMEHQRVTKDGRLDTALEKGWPAKIIKIAKDGVNLGFTEGFVKRIQVLLGWIKPWQPVIKTKPKLELRPATRWEARGYREKMYEREMDIARIRVKLRELGLRLAPYSGARVRRLEMELMGFRLRKPENKKYWWTR